MIPWSAKHTEMVAWCAGFFDGEGWLCVRSKPKNDRPNPRIEIVAGITNTEPHLLDVFCSAWGGSIRSRKGTALSRKPLYEWRVEGRRCAEFLLDVRPYLRGKQAPKADHLLLVREQTIRRRAA